MVECPFSEETRPHPPPWHMRRLSRKLDGGWDCRIAPIFRPGWLPYSPPGLFHFRCVGFISLPLRSATFWHRQKKQIPSTTP